MTRWSSILCIAALLALVTALMLGRNTITTKGPKEPRKDQEPEQGNTSPGIPMEETETLYQGKYSITGKWIRNTIVAIVGSVTALVVCLRMITPTDGTLLSVMSFTAIMCCDIHVLNIINWLQTLKAK